MLEQVKHACQRYCYDEANDKIVQAKAFDSGNVALEEITLEVKNKHLGHKYFDLAKTELTMKPKQALEKLKEAKILHPDLKNEIDALIDQSQHLLNKARLSDIHKMMKDGVLGLTKYYQQLMSSYWPIQTKTTKPISMP